MATCHQCGKADAQVGLLCRGCVELNKGKRNSVDSAYRMHSEESRISSSSFFNGQNTFYIVIALAVFFFIARSFGVFGYGSLPPLPLDAFANSSTDPCIGKDRCLVVFLAPWCPACKASIPFVQDAAVYAHAKSNLGFMTVVGLDEEAKLTRMAGSIGTGVYLDRQGIFYHALGGSGVPRWGVIDRNRKILNRGSGLPGGLTSAHPQFEQYLRNMFGLG